MKILIADDQNRTRQSLKALLSSFIPGIQIVEAANGREAFQQVHASTPEVVLMDVRMPEMDGLEATRRIKAAWPQVKVIVLSMYSDYKEEALRSGAEAFISKGEPPDYLLQAISTALNL